MSAAIAAANMNITLAHIEGGDVSGTIDESIRHSITKLAHYHFATNEDAKNRIIRMGEDTKRVFNFGSPDVEIAKKMCEKNSAAGKLNLAELGSNIKFNPAKDFLMVMYHPVTSEIEKIAENTKNLVKAVHELDMQTLWFWPNFDAGAEIISHELRHFKEENKNHKIKFLRYLPPREFLSLLGKTRCLIGNSSSGIKECSYLGIPVVDVGNRQNGRLKSANVLNCDNSVIKIKEAIKKQIKVGRYKPSNLYYSNDTSREIAKTLAIVDLYCQKCLVD
jgi:UDP-hydrolysing UDP-N-acetyl-D-glucosamine 2-epimerase